MTDVLFALDNLLHKRGIRDNGESFTHLIPIRRTNQDACRLSVTNDLETFAVFGAFGKIKREPPAHFGEVDGLDFGSGNVSTFIIVRQIPAMPSPAFYRSQVGEADGAAGVIGGVDGFDFLHVEKAFVE